MSTLEQCPFFVVLCPETDPPEVLSFVNTDEMVTWLKDFKPDQQQAVFIFQGNRLKFTRGPFRYLHGLAAPIPLFDPPTPETEEGEDDGLWFEDSESAQPMPKASPKAKSKKATGGPKADFKPLADDDDDDVGSPYPSGWK